MLDDGIVYQIANHFIHPKHDEPELHNDIGLIRIATPFKFTDKIQPIQLDPNYIPDAAPVVLTGWGDAYVRFLFSKNALILIQILPIQKNVEPVQ